jgi:hypothetical protein
MRKRQSFVDDVERPLIFSAGLCAQETAKEDLLLRNI